MGGSDLRTASPFVLRCLSDLRPVLGSRPTALDVAMGSGRHAVALAESGFRVFGVDCDYERVAQALHRFRVEGYKPGFWVADLELYPLPKGHFDVVLCTRYLQRTLWSRLQQAVAPRGFVLYETFTAEQCFYEWGPRSSKHLLRPGELRGVFADWDLWVYEERSAPAAEAGLLVRRPDGG